MLCRYDTLNAFASGVLGSWLTVGFANVSHHLMASESPCISWAQPLSSFILPHTSDVPFQIWNMEIRVFMETVGWALASSSNYYMSILSFKALTAPFWRLLIPNGNVRFYFLRKYKRKYKDVISERDKEFNLFRTRSIRNATEV